MAIKREITETNLPYKSFTDITSDASNLVLGSQNILTTAQQLMERIPGFSDAIEATPTVFTAASRNLWWVLWGGSRFINIVCDVAGGLAKVYKYEVGVDTNYVLIFTSAAATPFDFVVSNNTLYMGNKTEMRKYSGTGSSTQKWGIARPAALVSVGTTGTGISAYSGWYYRVTYGNSTTGHQSSSSNLSPCTGIVSNKTITLPLVASADGQVDEIHVYRSTDGGSTDPTQMLEITGSPFANTTTTQNDTTTDASLSIISGPSTTSNDPPTPCNCLIVYGARIFGAANSTTYFSADEELPSTVGVLQECWPSGRSGNNHPWPAEVTSQRPLPNGVAVFTRQKIWQISGTMRDNFIYSGLLDRRGALNHQVTASLGNSVAWLDTASQVFLDGQEIGFDIRSDILSINHSQAWLAIHIAGRFHWVTLLDGANGKLYIYDIDTQQWLPPKVLPAAASALSSGESAASTVSLTIALSKTKLYKMSTSTYNDGGTTYSPVCVVNLLRMGEPDGEFEGVAIETDSHTPSNVYFLPDEDPTMTSPPYQEITNNVSVPVRRNNGTNLVKQFYKAESAPRAERVSAKIIWPTVDANFTCYTITLNPDLTDNKAAKNG